MKHIEFSQRLLPYCAETLDKLAHPQALASAIQRCYIKRTTRRTATGQGAEAE
jgi:hypothetical protein